jgi:hypothetical protein
MASIGRLDAPLWLLSKFLKASCWGRKIGLRNDHGIKLYTYYMNGVADYMPYCSAVRLSQGSDAFYVSMTRESCRGMLG